LQQRATGWRKPIDAGFAHGPGAWDPRKDFSQCMQQPTIPSTSSAISRQQERAEPSGHRPYRHGTKSSLRREPDVPGDLLRALFGNVTEPQNQLPKVILGVRFTDGIEVAKEKLKLPPDLSYHQHSIIARDRAGDLTELERWRIMLVVL
jgi:hypothetical protein